MFTLFFLSALVTSDNHNTFYENKGIYFSGKIPSPTCNIDDYSDEELTKEKKTITCQNNKSVTIIKEKVILETGIKQDIWVITYED